MASPTRRTLKTIRVAGGNLFALAAQELGDATQWDRIARLNDLDDPMIEGVVTLVIPPVDGRAGQWWNPW